MLGVSLLLYSAGSYPALVASVISCLHGSMIMLTLAFYAATPERGSLPFCNVHLALEFSEER